jgi:hypothetical protein
MLINLQFYLIFFGNAAIQTDMSKGISTTVPRSIDLAFSGGFIPPPEGFVSLLEEKI